MAGADPPPADCAARARGVPSPSARTPRGAGGVRDITRHGPPDCSGTGCGAGEATRATFR
eukprot:771111-Prymnesium_polylepis.2